MRFTIIGCGNAGLIHAAKLYESENEVVLLKTSDYNSEFFDKMQKEGGYNVQDLVDNREFYVKPALITRDIKQAIEFADVIMVMTTTTHQEKIAQLISPFIKDGQIIVLVPGYMGSLLFKKYIKKDVVYCEWETTAYNGRIIDNEFVRISFYNPRNAISCLPSSKNEEVKDLLSQYFPNTRYCRKHILESALHNPNMIVHPIGMLFSASRIEYSDGDFYMYKEAFTDSIINVINNFDKVKNQILVAFDCEPLNYFDAAKWRNEEDLSIDSLTVFRSFADSSNKGPTIINHRYLNEDVPMGLGLFISIGKIVDVDTSIQEGIMALSSALLNKDFKKESRTIQYLLQKENISLEDIRDNIFQ